MSEVRLFFLRGTLFKGVERGKGKGKGDGGGGKNTRLQLVYVPVPTTSLILQSEVLFLIGWTVFTGTRYKAPQL